MATGRTIVTDLDDARTRLAAMCAADTPPVLQSSDLDRILAENQLIDTWQPNTAYAVGDVVVPTTVNHTGSSFRCVANVPNDDGTLGTSGDTEPVWSDLDQLRSYVVDGLDVGDIGAASQVLGDDAIGWVINGDEDDLWDLGEAASQAWSEKANRLATIPSGSRAGSSFDFNSAYQHCVERASYYGGTWIK